ncbi:MAG: SCO family protein [Acidobacteria bacterium]|nr:SCO family protein [Acidobacteriota bacterium]MCB9397712.1 SCO family protein [Acidobacteriota bacterium]
MRVLTIILFVSIGLFAQADRDAGALKAGVGIDEHLGSNVTLDLSFYDENGQQVHLRDYFGADKPVVIAPVYYKCPGFCSTILNGLTTALNNEELKLGEDFTVLAISFNPDENHELALEKAKNYYAMLEGQVGPGNWHFLTGNPSQIQTVMQELGFRYKRIGNEFSHASMLAILSPTGAISRYLYGVTFPKRDFHLGLVEASEGKIGTTIDQFLVYCYRFNQETGTYTVVAMRVLRIGGILTLLVMGTFGYFLWKKDPSNKRRIRENAN